MPCLRIVEFGCALINLARTVGGVVVPDMLLDSGSKISNVSDDSSIFGMF